MSEAQWVAVSTVILVLACVGVYAYKAIQVGKEIETLANLMNLAKDIERSESRKPTEIKELVFRRFENGEDPWGSQILFLQGSTEDPSDFLVLSKGSDRSLDIDDVNEYFRVEPQKTDSDRKGQDIVFRGSQALRYAAQK